MAAFPGFGISGYRSFFGEVQWVVLDPEVTVLLGGNNAGKSNAIRLIHLHMGAIFQSLRDASPVGSFAPRFDASRGYVDLGLEVHWPIDVDAMRLSPVFDSARDDLERLVSEHGGDDHCEFALPLHADALNAPLSITPGIAQAVAASAPGVNWEHLSTRLTSQSGGGPGEDTIRVLNFIRNNWTMAPPETALVPPSRALTAGAVVSGQDLPEWDLSGTGMVNQLRRLKAPAFDQRELRQRDTNLTRDLRILLEDETLEWNVSDESVDVRLQDEWYPLESLGTGTEQMFVILAARHVHPDRLLCLEEPDAHLHPRLQRLMMALLRGSEGHQLVVATHSAHLIDAADVVTALTRTEGRTTLTSVGGHGLFEALRTLGYRASDLLQTNCIIWVEGPSDRIYLLHWLHAVADDLVEGVDFSIAFYGGALLARLSATDEEVNDPTFVDLLRINRRMWVLMDRDTADDELRPAVLRLEEEIAALGSGGTWVTGGYTIENYVGRDALESAVRKVHTTVVALDEGDHTVNPLVNLRTADGGTLKKPDKVKIALEVCSEEADLGILDLADQVAKVVRFIRESPSDPVAEVVATEEP